MAHKIQIKRGDKADLPTLDVGEFGLCQDTNELFIGNSGNQKIFPPTASDIGLGNVENYSIATQSEAESGTANNRYMTPLRTKQAINTHNIYESSHQDIRQQINNLDADIDEHKAESAKQSFINSVSGVSRLRRAENRVVLTHFNGPPPTGSTGVTFDQVSERELVVTFPGAATYSVNIDVTRPVDPITNQYIEFLIQAENWKSVTNIEIRIIPDSSDTSSYYYASINIGNYSQNRSVSFRRHIDAFATQGSPSRFGLTANGRIRFGVRTTEATSITFWNGVISVNPMVPHMIMFDDGRKGVYDYAFPALKKRGIPATFYIVTDRVGTEGYVTWEQLREMQDAGWTIANHTSNHINLVNANLDDALEAVEKGAAALAENGLRGGNYLAAPFNAMDSTRTKYLAYVANVFRNGMAVSGLNSIGNVVIKQGFPTYIRGYSVKNTDSPTDLFQNYYVPARDKSMFFAFVFHKIEPPRSELAELEYDIDDFENFVDLLLADGALFSTVEEFARAYVVTKEDIPDLLRY